MQQNITNASEDVISFRGHDFYIFIAINTKNVFFKLKKTETKKFNSYITMLQIFFGGFPKLILVSYTILMSWHENSVTN